MSDSRCMLPLRPNVCMLVLNPEGRLFLGERAGCPGVWQLPQGGVDDGQSLEENVYRELNEELGADRSAFQIRAQLTATHQYDWATPPEYAIGRWRGQAQTFWVIDFIGTDEAIRLDSHIQEFMAWRWVEIDDVPRLAEPKRVAGYRAALVELKALLRG